MSVSWDLKGKLGALKGTLGSKVLRKLKRSEKKENSLLQFAEKVKAVIPPSLANVDYTKCY